MRYSNIFSNSNFTRKYKKHVSTNNLSLVSLYNCPNCKEAAEGQTLTYWKDEEIVIV